MTARADTLAPSSKLALYVAAVIMVYLIPHPTTAIAASVAICSAALIHVRAAGARIPGAKWRAVFVFVGWVFAMRVALDLVSGGSLTEGDTLLMATRQSARVAVLVIGVLALIALTPAKQIVDELETTRLPRAARLLVMMLVQYPRVLRDRYDQIVEAQVARGADRARTIVQRVSYGARVLLPVMQSELNAIGERAGLIHLRGLDVDVVISGDARRPSGRDLAAIAVAALAVIAAVAFRIAAR